MVCFATSVLADDADIKKAAKAQAEESQTALIKGEFEKLVDLTHPKLVENLGGKKKMVAHLTIEMKKMKEEGYEFKSVKVSDPGDPVRAGKELYIGIPFTLEMRVPGGRLLGKSMFIGVSKDDGKNWVFLDANPLKDEREQLKKLLPNLPAAIVIPKKELPVFIRD
jgi:hypothetical protein